MFNCNLGNTSTKEANNTPKLPSSLQENHMSFCKGIGAAPTPPPSPFVCMTTAFQFSPRIARTLDRHPNPAFPETIEAKENL